ncbi:glycosyltransferase family 2 protein [Planktomarina sp.]|nr:glycosyltransferase family 2 protein [Planktomarina sp.]
MIELSVVSVVKNEERYIKEMISSVLNTVPFFINLEIIIVDDHSADNTHKICCELASHHNIIKVYRNNGVGKVAGTIFGLNKATKSWIKCVDGDDFVDFSVLKIEEFNCNAFYHDYYRFVVNKRLKYVKTSNSLARSPSSWNFNLRSIPKGMFFFQKSLIDCEHIESFKEFLYEDVFINFIIGKNASKIVKLNKPLYFYRQHEENFYGDIKSGQRKIIRMRSRLLSNYEILSKLYPDYPINKNILVYCDALYEINWFNFFYLLLSPQLLLKALVYRVYAKF